MATSAATSAFSSAALTPRSRTLSSLPRSGKTPKRSRPTTARPATASALAESPSVRMSVHSCARRALPARFASSSFGMPRIRASEPPREARRSERARSAPARASSAAKTASPTPPGASATERTHLSGSSMCAAPAAAPSAAATASGALTSCSLLWLSKAGASMRALTKSRRCCRTSAGVTAAASTSASPGPKPAPSVERSTRSRPSSSPRRSARTRRAMCSASWRESASSTTPTCEPPRGVCMQFTKETAPGAL